MELIVDGEVLPSARLAELRTEAEELMKIFVTSIKQQSSDRPMSFSIQHSSFSIFLCLTLLM
jgi:hypothetical protein